MSDFTFKEFLTGILKFNDENVMHIGFNADTEDIVITNWNAVADTAKTLQTNLNGGGGAVLGSKTITENGTYDASDDDLDGYDQVTVNVPQGVVEILPDEYTAVNYVENSGDAYIDIGFQEYPKVLTGFSGRFAAHNVSESDARTLFGYQGTQVGTYRFTAQISTGNTLQYYGAASGASDVAGWIDEAVNDFSVDIPVNSNYPVWTVNNVETTGNKKKTTSNATEPHLFLMLSNFQNGILPADALVDGSYIRCYDFKVFCFSTLVRHYVPCIRNADSKVGFYEFITQEFYPSIGTNEFTSG